MITGARKGIGRFLAERYIADGMTVIGCSRQAPDYIGGNYEHFCVDVGDEQSVVDMFRAIRKRNRGIDVLINNAGIASMNHSLLTPARQVSQILDTNVLGTFLMCREGAKLMKRRERGRIVNFSTIAVPLRVAGEAAYVASKSAVEGLTRVLAREFAPLRITVNAIGPTPVATDLIQAVPKDRIEAILADQAIDRLGEPEDIANVIDFFVSPASDFVTGQVLYLGGV